MICRSLSFGHNDHRVFVSFVSFDHCFFLSNIFYRAKKNRISGKSTRRP